MVARDKTTDDRGAEENGSGAQAPEPVPRSAAAGSGGENNGPATKEAAGEGAARPGQQGGAGEAAGTQPAQPAQPGASMSTEAHIAFASALADKLLATSAAADEDADEGSLKSYKHPSPKTKACLWCCIEWRGQSILLQTACRCYGCFGGGGGNE